MPCLYDNNTVNLGALIALGVLSDIDFIFSQARQQRKREAGGLEVLAV